ncbi:MAG: tyrosyl-tRNA synthetase [Acidimicrobiales bacterium]
MTTDALAEFEARGLIHDTTEREALAEALRAGMITVYVGFDPTADSLHLGNLIPIMALRRMQLAGHKPIALVGGSTGMVGDPGGRSEERNLLDEETLAHNLKGISGVLRRFLDFDSGAENTAEMVNNFDWTGPVGVIDFLRDVGKHVTVNQMMAKDSVKSRLDSENGISFTEFSYMLLQAFDFWWLYENKNCIMQMGGSDQWGNITAGTDLVRKRSQGQAFALTWPLLTRSDGAKFGKTADGAIWLTADRTLPYEIHQYFLRVPDADVERMLLWFTLLPVDEVHGLMAEHNAAPDQRMAQRRLADEALTIIHGEAAVRQSNLAADALFGGAQLTGEMAESLRGIVPETTVAASTLDEEQNLIGLLVSSGLCSSRGDARRKIGENQISLNGAKIDIDHVESGALIEGRFLLLQRGKKARHLVVVDG